MYTLIIEDRNGEIADEYSFEEGEFLIGRSLQSDIILPSENVSRSHARLFTRGGRCYIEDAGSSNGVFLNGRRVRQAQEIGRSGQIKVGDFYLHIDTTADGVVDGAAVYCVLEAASAPLAGRSWSIARPVSILGRGRDCTTTIIDPSVSRVHATLWADADGVLRIEDLRSANGTFVNGERAATAVLRAGDRLRLGNVELVVRQPSGAVPAPGAGSLRPPPVAREDDEATMLRDDTPPGGTPSFEDAEPLDDLPAAPPPRPAPASLGQRSTAAPPARSPAAPPARSPAAPAAQRSPAPAPSPRSPAAPAAPRALVDPPGRIQASAAGGSTVAPVEADLADAEAMPSLGFAVHDDFMLYRRRRRLWVGASAAVVVGGVVAAMLWWPRGVEPRRDGEETAGASPEAIEAAKEAATAVEAAKETKETKEAATTPGVAASRTAPAADETRAPAGAAASAPAPKAPASDSAKATPLAAPGSAPAPATGPAVARAPEPAPAAAPAAAGPPGGGLSELDLLKQGEAAMRDRKWAEARVIFETLRDRDPLSPTWQSMLNRAALEARAEERWLEGTRYLEERRPGEALRALRGVTPQSAFYDQARTKVRELLDRRDELLGKGDALCKQKQWAGCHDLYVDAFAITPDDGDLSAKIKAVQKRLGR